MKIAVLSTDKLPAFLGESHPTEESLFAVALSGLGIILSALYTAFLSQFINRDAPMLNQYLILTITFIVVELVIEVVLALFAEKINQRLS